MLFIKRFCTITILILFLASNACALTIDDLTNRDWFLKSIKDFKINLASYIGKKPRIKFFADFRFSAWAGCNEIAGNYNFAEPDVLSFDQNMISTRMACDTPQNVEAEVMASLAAVHKVTIIDHVMQLFDANHTLLLEYTSLQNTVAPSN
jgi:heat shock protein HslJ